MTVPAERDPFGLRRFYYHADGPQSAPTLRALLANEEVPCRLCPQGVSAHLGRVPLDPEVTCFQHIRAVRPGHRLSRLDDNWRLDPLPPPEREEGTLLELLTRAVARTLDQGDVALALSGGLDSALLLAIVRRVLGRTIPVYSLCPSMPSYSERDRIVDVAASLDCRPVLVEAEERDFVAALPRCVAAAEVPFYNLHPVSKHLLAQRLHQDGIRRVLTGDGADQVFVGTPGWDYLPIVAALFEDSNVELCCPFLDAAVIAWAREAGAEPDKAALRRLARDLLPASVVDAVKVSRLAPPLDLRAVLDECAVARAASLLGEEPTDPGDVSWVSLGLLLRALRGC